MFGFIASICLENGAKRHHVLSSGPVCFVSEAGPSDIRMQRPFATAPDMPPLQPIMSSTDPMVSANAHFNARQFPGPMERGFVFPPPFALQSPTATNFGYPPFGPGGGPPGLVPLSPLPIGISGLSLSLPSPQTLDITSCQGPQYSMMGERPAQAFDVPPNALAGLVSSADIFSLPVTPRTPITPTVRYAQMHAAQAAGQFMAPTTTVSGVTLPSELGIGHGSFQFDHISQMHNAIMSAATMNGDTMSRYTASLGHDSYVPAITLSPPPKSKPVSRSSSFAKTEDGRPRRSSSGNTDEDTSKDLWRPY